MQLILCRWVTFIPIVLDILFASSCDHMFFSKLDVCAKLVLLKSDCSTHSIFSLFISIFGFS